ncbi:hypothetical protein GBAR_LOCUS11664 [Geodia barretti]|uniref:Uncharacterized protein n=1 Tax=Geodia barretti TaxID=519541 RepID=A0AA35WM10_GEOBA|nr:hypothetical protein GBAR_LOCUS11664 [Geodia barretti]
MRSYVKRL